MYRASECLLLQLLESRRMTQAELAERIGVTRQQVSKYANNHATMSYMTAYAIAEVLNCDMRDLYRVVKK